MNKEVCAKRGHEPMRTVETVRSLPTPMTYEVVSCARCGARESSVQFIRNRDEAGRRSYATSAPIGLGFKAVTVSLGMYEFWIGESDQKVILWPPDTEGWSCDGEPRRAPEFILLAQ